MKKQTFPNTTCIPSCIHFTRYCDGTDGEQHVFKHCILVSLQFTSLTSMTNSISHLQAVHHVPAV